MLKLISQVLLSLCIWIVTSGVSADEISGKVYWPNNNVAAGVTISVRGHSVTTDSKGRYTITKLLSGEHVLTISPPGKKTVPIKVNVSGTYVKNIVIDW